MAWPALPVDIEVHGQHIHAIPRTSVEHSSNKTFVRSRHGTADNYGTRPNRLDCIVGPAEQVGIHGGIVAGGLLPIATETEPSIPFVPDFVIFDFATVCLNELSRAVSVTLPSACRFRVASNAVTEHKNNRLAVLSSPIDAEIVVPVVVP